MDSKEYWQQRAERKVRMEKTDSDRAIKKIKSLYDSMLRQIQKEIDAFYARYATAEGVTLSELRKLLTKQELSSFKSSLNEYAKVAKTIQNGTASSYYYDYLKKLALRMNISRLEALKADITSYIMKLGIEEENIVASSMRDSYSESYYRTAYDVQQFEGKGKRVSQLNERNLNTALNEQWQGNNYSGRIWNNKEKLLSELENTFVRGIAVNMDPDDLSREISKNTGVSFRNAQRLVYTETAHIIEDATRAGYREQGVIKYQFIATLDDRTSEMCQEMDLKVFDVKDAVEGVNYPPLHPWCRSTTVPYFEPDEFDKVGTRAARDRQGRNIYVPVNMSYKEWKAEYID